jgi:hypothetical protein
VQAVNSPVPGFSASARAIRAILAAKQEDAAMAEIINLNRWRKAKAKEERARKAEANRAAFGRSKGERQAASKEADTRAKDLDGKKLEE